MRRQEARPAAGSDRAPLCVVKTHPEDLAVPDSKDQAEAGLEWGNISPTTGLFLTLGKHTSSCCMLALASMFGYLAAALSLELTCASDAGTGLPPSLFLIP